MDASMNKSQPGRIKRRVNDLYSKVGESVTPDFPKTILVEIGNLCNHRCVFCAYSKMTRPHAHIDLELLKRLLKEGYSLGARELGLYSSAEPFATPHLEQVILEAKNYGYKYIFVTTNGSLANEKRIKDCMDFGLDSLKFSINAGNREAYKIIHGQDHFDRVLKNLLFVNEYRKQLKRPFYLAVSSVAIEESGFCNKESFKELKNIIDPIVDEHAIFDAYNQNGQMIGLAPSKVTAPCTLPFHRVHISAEGYLRACCNDYQNYLALVDLKETSLETAWNSPTFKQFRKRHLDQKTQGLLCFNCIHGKNTPIKPLNPDLAVKVPSEFFNWSPTNSEAQRPKKIRISSQNRLKDTQ